MLKLKNQRHSEYGEVLFLEVIKAARRNELFKELREKISACNAQAFYYLCGNSRLVEAIKVSMEAQYKTEGLFDYRTVNKDVDKLINDFMVGINQQRHGSAIESHTRCTQLVSQLIKGLRNVRPFEEGKFYSLVMKVAVLIDTDLVESESFDTTKMGEILDSTKGWNIPEHWNKGFAEAFNEQELEDAFNPEKMDVTDALYVKVAAELFRNLESKEKYFKAEHKTWLYELDFCQLCNAIYQYAQHKDRPLSWTNSWLVDNYMSIERAKDLIKELVTHYRLQTSSCAFEDKLHMSRITLSPRTLRACWDLDSKVKASPDEFDFLKVYHYIDAIKLVLGFQAQVGTTYNGLELASFANENQNILVEIETDLDKVDLPILNRSYNTHVDMNNYTYAWMSKYVKLV